MEEDAEPLAGIVSRMWRQQFIDEGIIMPSIVNVKPSPAPWGLTNGAKTTTGRKTATGILSRVVPVGANESPHLKFCVYGQNRTGKTTLACWFPKPLLLVSFEPSPSGGMESVRAVKNVDYVRLTQKNDVEELARELQTDDHFKTVVLDSATSLEDLVLMNLKGLTEPPVQLGFGAVSDGQYIQRSEQAKELVRLFINLPKHVVVTAKEKDHVKSDDVKEARTAKLTMVARSNSFFSAGVGTGFAGWLFDACSHFCRLWVDEETTVEERVVKVAGKEKIKREEIATGRYVRKLRTTYHPNYGAGFRSEVPSAVPEWIQLDGTQADFNAIMEVVSGKRTTKGRYND